FFGFGNETELTESDIKYYRMRSAEWIVRAGLSRELGKSSINIQSFFRSIDIKTDTSTCAEEFFGHSDNNLFNRNNYGGVSISYSYLSVNDSIVPTKGMSFLFNGSYANNFSERDFFQKYDGRLQAYLPLSNKLSMLFRVGGTTVVGPTSVLNSPQSFPHAIIGGPEYLRGYRFDRFWGRTSFYNNNEIRFITNLKTYFLNAKIGFTGFFDDGRVWIPEEDSQTIHTSYGVGMLLAPFNFACFGLTYGISNESKLFQ